MKKLVWAILVIAVAAAGIVLVHAMRGSSAGKDAAFREQAVERGDVVASVTASGAVSSVTTVLVGSQVSGIIAALHADFNDDVTKGQSLAELDPAPFQATVDQRSADLERVQSDLRQADLVFARSKRLHSEGIVSQDEYDAAANARTGAAASVKVSQASLQQAKVNLQNTRITSPIDGVVVDRQFDVGQTVAASFSAPTLFTIAQDLTHMQVKANVDEADIGGVHEGQEATFTVDAFPDQPFHGRVSQVRLSPVTVQNVVTYPVVMDVENAEGRLKPGMTASVQIPVDARRNTLRVPNAALRFKPDPSLVVAPPSPAAAAAPDSPPNSPAGTPAAGGGTGRGGRRGGGGAGHGGRRESVVYVAFKGGKVRAVPVRTSITDGTFTAIEDGPLAEGDKVIVGLATAKASSASRAGGPAPMGGGGGGGRRF